MPLYSDMVRIEGEYNYSANIQFDMENDRKLLRFIPNETTVELLREFFIDITRANPEHHARILYGSYGTGKSHFLTVLGLLLGKSYTDGIAYRSFISRISDYDENLAVDINSFITSTTRKPMLIVPIVFDFDDFDRCIYFSLKKKLESIGRRISFKTFFDQAADLLNQWKNNEESAERLNKACDNVGISLQNLEKTLRVFDKSAESTFQKVFSEMTFGVKYIYEVSNIEENIAQANAAIADEYAGIVFIFDEFGRYIEDNIKNIKVKAVQDLAEYCDHGSDNNHIILVSHKEISQYTQRFGKSVANEWKKVEGRYKATPINDRQDQCLSLIRNILIKDDETWSLYKETYKKELNKMYSEAFDFKGFLIDAAQGDNPFEGGFPLHPISLYALDKLSKRVAQNERTFFTFLASRDENSLYRFLNGKDLSEFHFVGIDEIFDYFEPSIKSTQSDASYEWYKELQTALSKNNTTSSDTSPETKILKVIATIGIINDSSALVANKATILSVIDCPKEVLSNALEGLCESRIIKYSGAYDRFDFFEASIFDVEAMIADESLSVSDDAVINTLNDEFISFALYPNQYNRVYKITRVFLPVFASLQDLQKKSFAHKFGKYYDGLFVMLMSNADVSKDEILGASAGIPRSILSANLDVSELSEAVRSYIASKYLYSQRAKYSAEDPAFEKELAYFNEELKATITALIQEWQYSFDGDVILASNGQELSGIKSFNELSGIASDIMFECYPDTLIVNNELINKNSISGTITSAKKNVIANIIRGMRGDTYYGTPYLSPDYIAVRSVLVKNSFVNEIEGISYNQLPDGRFPQENVKRLINAFIGKGKTENVSFEDLYTQLKEPPFGLRNGYLSLLLSHVLMPYRKSLLINSHGVEQEITVDLFEEIIKRPADYSFTIADWSQEQIDYLEALEQLYQNYISETSLSKNRLKAIYDAMMSHYKNTTKFARTTQRYVADETKAYRKLLEKSAANYSTFLFAKVRNLGGDYSSAVNVAKKAKAELDDAVFSLSRDLTEALMRVFTLTSMDGNNLSEKFITIYNKTWAQKRSKSFDYYTNAFLEIVSNIRADDSDNDIVVKLSKALTGFELIYWNDSHKDEFVERIEAIKNKLDAYVETNALGDQEVRMTLVTSTGAERSVVFDRKELGNLSKTVRNKIESTFANYGLSIGYDDKVQILLSLLEDLMEGK